MRKNLFKLQSIKWLFAETIVLSIGVFIALQVENWRENRADRRSEQVALKSILSDLESDKTTIQRYTVISEERADSISEMLKPLIKGEPLAAHDFAQLYVDVTFGASLTTRSTTYMGLRDGTKLNLISNEQLRSQIIDYYERFHPYIQRRVSAIDDRDLRFIENASADIYRSVLSEATPGRQIVEAQNRSGDIWMYSVPQEFKGIPSNSDFFGSANEFAIQLSMFRTRVGPIVVELENLINEISIEIQN